MKPQKIDRNDVKKLSPADRSMLCAVYLYRCLTLQQMYEFFFKQENEKRTYAAWHLKEMVEKNYLTPISFLDDGTGNEAYFLTTTGVSLVKRLLDIPSTRLPGLPQTIRDYDWHSADLKLSPGKINHQVHLNSFALRFARELARPFEYFDEKYVPNKDIYSMRARADGLAELPERSIYFELDMGTESIDALKAKWYGYQTLVNSHDFFEASQKKNGVILFILDNVKRPEIRKRTVLKSLADSQMLNLLSKSFDLYIGTPEEMIGFCREELFPSKRSKLYERVETTLEKSPSIQILPQDHPEVSPCDFLCRCGDSVLSIDVMDRVHASALCKCLSSNRDQIFLQDKYRLPVRHLTVTEDLDMTEKSLQIVDGDGIQSSLLTYITDFESGNILSHAYSLNKFGERIYIEGGQA